MTPVLKALIEAMLAEVRQQNALDRTVSDPPPTGTVVFVSGVVDLEKVARAGVAAIPLDVLARAIYALDPQTEPGDPDEPNEPLNGVRKLSWDECDLVFCEAAAAEAKAIIDAILGEGDPASASTTPLDAPALRRADLWRPRQPD